MGLHVKEHCRTPELPRRMRITGFLWSCDCGRVWRGYWFTSSIGGRLWTWKEVQLTCQDAANEDELRSKVFQALGAASTCWIPNTGDLEFDSSRAKEIGDELMEWIEANK